MIALVDYGAGNLTSVRKALAAVGADVFTPESAGDLAEAHGIIVPGVGHFAATAALDSAWERFEAWQDAWAEDGYDDPDLLNDLRDDR